MARFATDTLAVWQCFTVLGLFGLYLKVALLGSEWVAIARFHARDTPDQLTIVQRLGFFAGDIGLNLILVPAIGTIATCLIFRRYRVGAAVTIGALLSFAYFVELRAQTELGQYISGEVVRDGLGWAFTNPSSMGDYVTAASLAKLGGLLAWLTAIAIAARAARRAVGDPVRAARYRRFLAAPAIAITAAAAIAAPIAFASRLDGSPLNTSAVTRAVTALTASDAEAGDDGPRRTPAEAVAAFHRLTRTLPVDAAHPFVGREADADVLVFLMETGPAQALDLATAARTLPGARRLAPHAFLGRAHYTAHPYSSDAVFSLLSGDYPHARRRVLRDEAPASMAGLFASLPASIEHRAVYLPSLYRIELDDRMYAAFGARLLYVADRRPEDPLAAGAAARAEATVEGFERDGARFDARTRRALIARLFADLQALARVKADVAAALAARRRYAVMFFPEIGHSPWPSLDGKGDAFARCGSLMRLQDAWLGEILDVIARAGRVDRTVVVVTADHGLRTRAEYPELPVGYLSDVTFRVPLLVHAPRTLSAPQVLDAPTSHVDLAPTVLALVGATDGAARMAGVPVWQRRASDRIYLLGAAYGGADGFVEDGRYYMRQALSGGVYASDRLAFDAMRPLRPPDPRIPWITEGLAAARELQHALTAPGPLPRPAN